MTDQPMVRVPRRAKRGEVILVRAKVRHPMETGWRKAGDGSTVPRKRLHSFACTLNGETVISAELHSGVSMNPYLAFYARVTESGRFEFTWIEDGGRKLTASAPIEVS